MWAEERWALAPRSSACSSIHSVQITANIAPSYGDAATKTYRVFSITSKARMNNNNPVI